MTATAAQRLAHLAGLGQAPGHLPHTLVRGVAVLAAALGGFGVILWLASQWAHLGRMSQFALLQLGLVLAGLGACWRGAGPGRMAALGLLAFLGTGGLLAYFGQTYQTGADPWQLFALWAALMLPLCGALRSDVLWTPWVVVAMTGVTLWLQASLAHQWRLERTDLPLHLAAWALWLGLALALSPALRRWTGAGPWAFRLGWGLAATAVSGGAAFALISSGSMALYGLGLLLLGVAALLLSRTRWFDLFALGATCLGLNGVLVVGLVRWLLRSGIDGLGVLILPGLLAAGLSAGSVYLVTRLARRQAAEVGSAA